MHDHGTLHIVLIYLAVINVVTFFVYGIDKWKAKHSKWRINETQLLQMLLPISAAAKGVLWTILFGLAKTCQYGGLTILGVEGYNRVKNWIKRRKDDGVDEV
jgi:hypothetical protein